MDDGPCDMPWALPIVQARLAPGSLIDSLGRFLVEPVEPATVVISSFARPSVGQAATAQAGCKHETAVFSHASAFSLICACSYLELQQAFPFPFMVLVCIYDLLFLCVQISRSAFTASARCPLEEFFECALYMVLDIVSRVSIYQNIEVTMYRTYRTCSARYIGLSMYRIQRFFTRYIDFSMYRDVSYVSNLFCPPPPGIPHVFLADTERKLRCITARNRIDNCSFVLSVPNRSVVLFVGFVSVGCFQ